MKRSILTTGHPCDTGSFRRFPDTPYETWNQEAKNLLNWLYRCGHTIQFHDPNAGPPKWMDDISFKPEIWNDFHYRLQRHE